MKYNPKYTKSLVILSILALVGTDTNVIYAQTNKEDNMNDLSIIRKDALPVPFRNIQTDKLVDMSNIQITNGNSKEIFIQDFANLNQGTFLIEYTSTSENKYQSLISISNSTVGNENRYFHVYVTNDGGLGVEIRNTDKVFKYNYYIPSAVKRKYKGEYTKNYIAFVADSQNKEYKLFANGNLLKVFKEDKYKFINDIFNVNKVKLGATSRKNIDAYPFEGVINRIEIYSKVLTDNYIKEVTSIDSKSKYIFQSRNDVNANYYRIPSLYTLNDGTLISAIDARYGGTHDSPNKINITFSKSEDNGQSWSNPVEVFKFEDYKKQELDWPRDENGKNLRIKESASFIDPVLVEDKNSNRIYIFADVMPAGIGSSNAKLGSGYKIINDKKYLKLYKNGDPIDKYNYSVREDGIIYDDLEEKKTDYSINGNLEVLYKNNSLYVKQYEVDLSDRLNETKSDEDVKMNIMYKDSLFKVYPTTYMGMKYSDDKGETWSDITILNKDMKSEDEKAFITGPGRGLQITKGKYKDRLIVPVYTVSHGKFGVLYKDSQTEWKYSAGPDEPSLGIVTAETQFVEMPDGSLMAFERTLQGKVASSISRDGGVTWENRKLENNLPSFKFGTQVSVINLNGLIDGQPAIALSSPNSTESRKDGKIRIGLIDKVDNEYKINWKYSLDLDSPNVGFSYSCLTQLKNGDIGILYERYDSWSRDELHLKNVIPFEKYSIDDIRGN